MMKLFEDGDNLQDLLDANESAQSEIHVEVFQCLVWAVLRQIKVSLVPTISL